MRRRGVATARGSSVGGPCPAVRRGSAGELLGLQHTTHIESWHGKEDDSQRPVGGGKGEASEAAGSDPWLSPPCRKQPYYGYDGQRPVRCVEHKKAGMVDVVNRRCEEDGCRTRPCYGYGGDKAIRCAKHKLEGMVSKLEGMEFGARDSMWLPPSGSAWISPLDGVSRRRAPGIGSRRAPESASQCNHNMIRNQISE
jgi:hypothetical protein